MFKVKAIGNDKTIRLGLKESRGQLSDLMVNYNKKTGRNKKKERKKGNKGEETTQKSKGDKCLIIFYEL